MTVFAPSLAFMKSVTLGSTFTGDPMAGARVMVPVSKLFAGNIRHCDSYTWFICSQLGGRIHRARVFSSKHVKYGTEERQSLEGNSNREGAPVFGAHPLPCRFKFALINRCCRSANSDTITLFPSTFSDCLTCHQRRYPMQCSTSFATQPLYGFHSWMNPQWWVIYEHLGHPVAPPSFTVPYHR